jgi:hypothetical protein
MSNGKLRILITSNFRAATDGGGLNLYPHIERGLKQLLTDQISELMHTRKSPFPARRTLMSSGILHAMMQSTTSGEPGRDTPELDWKYTTDWVWPGVSHLGQ